MKNSKNFLPHANDCRIIGPAIRETFNYRGFVKTCVTSFMIKDGNSMTYTY